VPATSCDPRMIAARSLLERCLAMCASRVRILLILRLVTQPSGGPAIRGWAFGIFRWLDVVLTRPSPALFRGEAATVPPTVRGSCAAARVVLTGKRLADFLLEREGGERNDARASRHVNDKQQTGDKSAPEIIPSWPAHRMQRQGAQALSNVLEIIGAGRLVSEQDFLARGQTPMDRGSMHLTQFDRASRDEIDSVHSICDGRKRHAKTYLGGFREWMRVELIAQEMHWLRRNRVGSCRDGVIGPHRNGSRSRLGGRATISPLDCRRPLGGLLGCAVFR
jgi:hypothetical protein